MDNVKIPEEGSLMRLKGEKVAVLGGSGFFGTHVVDVLKQKGSDVVVSKSADFDFRDSKDCRKFFQRYKPRYVINCAAFQGGIGFHAGKQAQLFKDNMLMGMFLMDEAQQAGVGKFVNIVAGCAYPGYLEIDILNETDFWNGQEHDSIFSYGFSRKASVVFGKALNKQHGFNSIHLVYANMYGPGDHFNPDKSKALAALIKKIYEAKLNNEPSVEIWGSGKPLRDWLYVTDGAIGAVKALELYESNEPLNIATGNGISVRELAEAIKRAVGYKGELRYNTEKPDGAMKKVFGVRKMKKVLKWQPETKINQGIKETVLWFDKNYSKIDLGR